MHAYVSSSACHYQYPLTRIHRKKSGNMAVDLALWSYLAFWYLGNYYYNIQNKTAANAAGGSKFAMTIATVQLAVGVVYAIFLWIAPDARKPPKITFSDFIKVIPSGVCSAGAHAASVFSLAAGGVAFGQIVKAAEPAFAALIGTIFYGKKISVGKWLTLVPIIGKFDLFVTIKIDT